MTLVIRRVNVVDPAAREVRADRSLVIEGETVRAETAAAVAPPEGADVIDGGGQYAVPGLIDAHIHLRATPHVGPSNENPTPRLVVQGAHELGRERYVSRLHSFVYCGVTSVYDAGNDSRVIFGLRDDERNGRIVSPRIHATGNLFTAPGGHGSTAAVPVPEDADVARLVAEHVTHGPDVVKITYDEHGWGVRPLVPILSERLLARLIDEVHGHGLKVTVHVSNELRARQALEAGADILAHPVIQSPMNLEFAEQVAAADVPVVSTLTIGDRYARLADDPGFLDLPLYRDCEWPDERERLKTEESRFQRGNRWADWMRAMTPVAQENLEALVLAGATVAAGTDQSFGPDYHRELELLRGAGIEPWDVLRAATVNAARALDRAGELGTLDVGARADLLLVEADPTQDVAALASADTVVKSGAVVDRADLELPVNAGVAV